MTTSISHYLSGMFIQRDLLEEEEARLITAVSSVRRKLNELTPISQLPPEVLEEIFTLCVSWFYGYQKPKHRLAWTQVCHSWRHIALDSGRLWQRIDLCDAGVADEFLARSKQAPLFVMSSSPLKLTPTSLTLHASRLKSIDVFLFPNDMAHFFSRIGRNFPMLTNLSLKITPMSSTIFLDLSIPSVTRLSLEGVAVRWNECKNLTYLSLRGYHQATCPSLAELQELLDSSPNIQYVRLECYIPSSSEIDDERPPIYLPFLKDLIISSKPAVIRSILSTLVLADQTRLQLYLSLSEDLFSLFPSGLPYYNNLQPKSISRNAAQGIALNVNTVRLCRHGAYFLRPNAPAWCDDPSAIQLSLSSASPLGNHVCGSLGHVLDLTSITRLELNTGVLLDITQKALQSLFSDLHHMEWLCTAFNDIEDLIAVLQSIDDSTGQLYLPRLRTLSFSKPYDLWWHFGGRWMEEIFRALRYRQDQGTPLKNLELFGCHGISSTVIEDFGSIVQNVVVDSEQLARKGQCF